MKRAVRRSDQAELDLINLYAYLHVDSPDLAERFLSGANDTFAFLATAPHVGRRFTTRRAAIRNLRVWPVRGFPNHLIFYAHTRDELLIVRVIHGARDLPRRLQNP